jgi:two-component sensor histidine kinase
MRALVWLWSLGPMLWQLRTSLLRPEALVAQAASALEKARLAEANAKKQRDAEREKFLSALLSSVSHDFKTPLVTVIGALSSLKDMKQVQENFESREVVAGGLEEAQKLNRFINNLVEISRLESRLEAIRKEPVVLRDILASSLKSLHPLIGRQRFSIQTSEHFLILHVNSALMELVFLNLLENAVKYGPADGEVKIIASVDANGATIDIDDDGEGIPEAEREAIFVKFYRSKHGDRKIAGTGLGLYICRGIVEEIVAYLAAGFALGDRSGGGEDELGSGLLEAFDQCFQVLGVLGQGNGDLPGDFVAAGALPGEAVAEVVETPIEVDYIPITRGFSAGREPLIELGQSAIGIPSVSGDSLDVGLAGEAIPDGLGVGDGNGISDEQDPRQ